MTGASQVVARQLTRSGEALLLGLEPVDDGEFFAELPTGFSAAWTAGHLACFADLFSSWFEGRALLFEAGFHAVFNDTAVAGDGPASKAAGVDRDTYPKALLLLRLRQALVKALRVLAAFDAAGWDAPGPPGAPILLTAGAIWEILAVHVYWHMGELAGSMPRFRGTYTLNVLPHHVYVPPETRANGHARALSRQGT